MRPETTKTEQRPGVAPHATTTALDERPPTRASWRRLANGARQRLANRIAWFLAPEQRGLLIVTAIAVVYTTLWCVYLFQKHDAFRTGAEDLGIMDQVLWATAHGHFMYESVCNPITDLNCLVSMRFAIHFEPILIPLAPLYWIIPSPKLLLFLQTAAAASGVYPVFLLAVHRLRHAAWGVAFAVLFLLCPMVQTAVVDDFHPEVFAAPLLLWALYFIATRRDRGLIAVCLVALLCKETIALVVLCLGVYVALRVGRRRLGAVLVVLGAGTLALALLIMRLTSPIGRSPVTTRFDPLAHDPLTTLFEMITDPARYGYLVDLVAQTGFLALFSPWMLAVAAPSVAVNFFSANSNMYSGIAQYNVHLAPLLIAGAIDGVAWLRPRLPRLLRWLATRRLSLRVLASKRLALIPILANKRLALIPILASLLLAGAWGVGLQHSISGDYTLYGWQGYWPAQTAHTRLGARLIAMIPPKASVSAEAGLVAHLSQRLGIYQYPSGATTADYILLDVTTGTFYPFERTEDYMAAFHALLNSTQFELVDADDGYLLLHRLPPDLQASQGQPITLPPAFFSFVVAAPSGTDMGTLMRQFETARLLGYDSVFLHPAGSNRTHPPLAPADWCARWHVCD